MKVRLVLQMMALAALLLPVWHVQAQEAPQPAAPAQPLIVGLYPQGAFTIAHSIAMRHLATSHPVGGEFSVQWQTTGRKFWHQLHRFPKIGVNFLYYDYRHPVLGKSYAVSTYINKPLKQGPKHQLNVRIGTGICYITDVYHLQENPKNSIFGSHLNAVLQTRFEYEWHFSEPVSLSVGLGLNHFSNGATSKPNLGINLPTATVGLNYYSSRPTFQTQELPEWSRRSFYNVSVAPGFKKFGQSIESKRYFAMTVSALYLKPLSQKGNFIAGVEGFYDNSTAVKLLADSLYVSEPDKKRAAVLVGYELLFGQMAFQTELGIYVYRPYKIDRGYYERLAIKYHFTPKVFGAIGLKVHRGTADYIEWTVGARLR